MVRQSSLCSSDGLAPGRLEILKGLLPGLPGPKPIDGNLVHLMVQRQNEVLDLLTKERAGDLARQVPIRHGMVHPLELVADQSERHHDQGRQAEITLMITASMPNPEADTVLPTGDPEDWIDDVINGPGRD